MENKKEMKVGLAEVSNLYKQYDHVMHGTENYYAVKRLMEYKGKIYLLSGDREEIKTDESAGYTLGAGVSKHDNIYDILSEFDISIPSEDMTVEYLSFNNIELINEDGSLSEVNDEELLEEVRKLKDIFCIYSEEKDIEDGFEDSYDSSTEILEGNINYSDIPAHIERDEKTGIIKITAYGKTFEYDGMLNLRKQKEDELKECMKEDEQLDEILLKTQQLEQVQENENKI